MHQIIFILQLHSQDRTADVDMQEKKLSWKDTTEHENQQSQFTNIPGKAEKYGTLLGLFSSIKNGKTKYHRESWHNYYINIYNYLDMTSLPMVENQRLEQKSEKKAEI